MGFPRGPWLPQLRLSAGQSTCWDQPPRPHRHPSRWSLQDMVTTASLCNDDSTYHWHWWHVSRPWRPSRQPSRQPSGGAFARCHTMIKIQFLNFANSIKTNLLLIPSASETAGSWAACGMLLYFSRRDESSDRIASISDSDAFAPYKEIAR
jgi:hypothetical protein